jgi:hypothetical protein
MPLGELAISSEARFPSEGERRGDGDGTKFCVLTLGDLSVSVMVTVTVEDEGTRW